MTKLFIAALTVAVLLVPILGILGQTMRNKRGLYDWPLPIQWFLCLTCGIPLSEAGLYKSGEEFMDRLRAYADPADLNGIGRLRRREARERLGLENEAGTEAPAPSQ